MGVPKALGLSLEDWVQHRLGGYIRLSVSERREAVKSLAEEGESQRGIAKVLGVDEGTIRNDLRAEKSAANGEVIEVSQETKAAINDPAENSAPPLDVLSAGNPAATKKTPPNAQEDQKSLIAPAGNPAPPLDVLANLAADDEIRSGGFLISCLRRF